MVEMNYICPIEGCGKKFPKKSGLNGHLRFKHKEAPPTPEQKTESRQYLTEEVEKPSKKLNFPIISNLDSSQLSMVQDLIDKGKVKTPQEAVAKAIEMLHSNYQFRGETMTQEITEEQKKLLAKLESGDDTFDDIEKMLAKQIKVKQYQQMLKGGSGEQFNMGEMMQFMMMRDMMKGSQGQENNAGMVAMQEQLRQQQLDAKFAMMIAEIKGKGGSDSDVLRQIEGMRIDYQNKIEAARLETDKVKDARNTEMLLKLQEQIEKKSDEEVLHQSHDQHDQKIRRSNRQHKR